DQAHLLEVERRPLEAARCTDAGDHNRASALHDADADLERVGLADGVVDDVDVAGMAEGQALPRAAQDATRPPSQSFDEFEAGFGLEHGGPELARHLRLAGPTGDRRHLYVGVELAQDGGGGRAQRSGAVDDRLPTRRWGRARDGVQ